MEANWKSLLGYYDACTFGVPSPEAIREVFTVLPLHVMFNLIDDAAKRDDEISLRKVLHCLKVTLNSSNDFDDEITTPGTLLLLRNGLYHSHVDVRVHTLELIKSKFTNGLEPGVKSSRITILEKHKLLGPIATLLRDEIKVSELASLILLQIASITDERHILTVLNLLKEVRQEVVGRDDDDGSINFRIMKLTATISGLSPLALGLCLKEGAMKMLEDMVLGDDILLQMNALHLIEKASCTVNGIKYLESSGIINKLVSISHDNSLLTESSIKIVSVIVSNASKLDMQSFANPIRDTILKKLSDEFQSISGDITSLSLSEIASGSLDNLLCIMDMKELVVKWLKLVDSSSGGGNDKDETIVVATLHGLGVVLRAMWDITVQNVGYAEENKTKDSKEKPSINVWKSLDNERATLAVEKLRRLFNAIGVCNGRKETLNIMLEFTKKPFEAIRYGAYDFLRSSLKYAWALEIMNSNNAFKKWILDKTLEASHEGKQWKFSIVESIMKCKDVESILDDEFRSQLTEYLKTGPFYTKTSRNADLSGGINL